MKSKQGTTIVIRPSDQKGWSRNLTWSNEWMFAHVLSVQEGIQNWREEQSRIEVEKEKRRAEEIHGSRQTEEQARNEWLKAYELVSVYELPIAKRTMAALANNEILFVAQLQGCRKTDLLKFKGIGLKSLVELHRALLSRRIYLLCGSPHSSLSQHCSLTAFHLGAHCSLSGSSWLSHAEVNRERPTSLREKAVELLNRMRAEMRVKRSQDSRRGQHAR